MFPQHLGGGALDATELHESAQIFAHDRIGDTDHRALGNAWVLEQDVLELRWIDVFSAFDDEIVLAAAKIEEAVLVTPAVVARVKPTTSERLLVELGPGVVAQ